MSQGSVDDVRILNAGDPIRTQWIGRQFAAPAIASRLSPMSFGVPVACRSDAHVAGSSFTIDTEQRQTMSLESASDYRQGESLPNSIPPSFAASSARTHFLGRRWRAGGSWILIAVRQNGPRAEVPACYSQIVLFRFRYSHPVCGSPS